MPASQPRQAKAKSNKKTAQRVYAMHNRSEFNPSLVVRNSKQTKKKTIKAQSSAIDSVVVIAVFFAVSYMTSNFCVAVSPKTDVIEGKLLDNNERSPTQ